MKASKGQQYKTDLVLQKLSNYEKELKRTDILPARREQLKGFIRNGQDILRERGIMEASKEQPALINTKEEVKALDPISTSTKVGIMESSKEQPALINTKEEVKALDPISTSTKVGIMEASKEQPALINTEEEAATLSKAILVAAEKINTNNSIEISALKEVGNKSTALEVRKDMGILKKETNIPLTSELQDSKNLWERLKGFIFKNFNIFKNILNYLGIYSNKEIITLATSVSTQAMQFKTEEITQHHQFKYYPVDKLDINYILTHGFNKLLFDQPELQYLYNNSMIKDKHLLVFSADSSATDKIVLVGVIEHISYDILGQGCPNITPIREYCAKHNIELNFMWQNESVPSQIAQDKFDNLELPKDIMPSFTLRELLRKENSSMQGGIMVK